MKTICIYPNLEIEMVKKRVTRKQIAMVTGKSESAVSERMTKKGKLKFSEAVQIRDELFPGLSLDYLYAS